MSVDEKKNSKRETLEQEIEAAVAERTAGLEPPEEGEMFQRFNRNFRFQHIVMFTSVILLIITGMPIKFPDFVLSRFLVNLWGGFHNSTIVHRIGAGMLIYFMVHHLFYTVLSRQGRRAFGLLIPTPKDARDLVQNIRHFLGKAPVQPRFGRVT